MQFLSIEVNIKSSIVARFEQMRPAGAPFYFAWGCFRNFVASCCTPPTGAPGAPHQPKYQNTTAAHGPFPMKTFDTG